MRFLLKILFRHIKLFVSKLNYESLLFGKFLIPIILISFLTGSSFHQNQDKNFYVRLGYSVFAFQDVSPVDANAAVQVYAEAFKERMEKRLKKPVIFTSALYNSVDEIVETLNKNELDLISILTTEYFQIKKRHDIYPFLAVTAKEDAYEHYYIIVRNDLKIKHIADLMGKSLSIPDPKYHPVMMEWLYNYLIKNNMPEPSNTFSRIKTFDKESNAVYDIFFKNSDCAIARENVYTTLCELNPQMAKSLTVFVISVPMVLAFLAANSLSDQELMRITVEEIKDFHLTPGGKNILNIFKANKWIRISNRELKSVEEIINENTLFRKKLLSKRNK